MKNLGDRSPKEVVKYLASRIMFVNDDIIRILNEEDLDYLVDSRTFELLTFTKIDNLKQSLTKNEVHTFLEKRALDLDEVFVRLLRKNQDQKVWLD